VHVEEDETEEEEEEEEEEDLSAHADRASPTSFTHGHPPTSSPAAAHVSCRSSCRHAWLRVASTDIGTSKNHRDVRGA